MIHSSQFNAVIDEAVLTLKECRALGVLEDDTWKRVSLSISQLRELQSDRAQRPSPLEASQPAPAHERSPALQLVDPRHVRRLNWTLCALMAINIVILARLILS